jgi:hypothetical protein
VELKIIYKAFYVPNPWFFEEKIFFKVFNVFIFFNFLNFPIKNFKKIGSAQKIKKLLLFLKNYEICFYF